MDYKVSDIRKELLKLKDGSQEGFFIEIKPGAEIVFHREVNKITIRNHNNLNFGSLTFDRDNLNRGSSDTEKDYLFGTFLENVKGQLSKLGL